MEKIELADSKVDFDIEGRVFTVDLSDEALGGRVRDWDDIYDSIVAAQSLEDLVMLYEKAVTALFGKGSFTDIYSICGENLYVLADLMLKISRALSPERDSED